MKQKTLHFLSLVISLVGGLMAFSDKFNPLSFISPSVAQFWPLVLVAATVVDRTAKLIGDALDDGALNGSFRFLLALLLCAAMTWMFTGCASGSGNMPRVNVGVTGSYAGVGYHAGYDGKTIVGDLQLPDPTKK